LLLQLFLCGCVMITENAAQVAARVSLSNEATHCEE
jgi:hypothetical protein